MAATSGKVYATLILSTMALIYGGRVFDGVITTIGEVKMMGKQKEKQPLGSRNCGRCGNGAKNCHLRILTRQQTVKWWRR
jgi:hypothetical protein